MSIHVLIPGICDHNVAEGIDLPGKAKGNAGSWRGREIRKVRGRLIRTQPGSPALQAQKGAVSWKHRVHLRIRTGQRHIPSGVQLS